MAEANENCLVGWKCPKCGKADCFHISGAVVHLDIYLYDSGTDEAEVHSTDWEEENDCRCVDCGYEAKVKDFKEQNQNGV